MKQQIILPLALGGICLALGGYIVYQQLQPVVPQSVPEPAIIVQTEQTPTIGAELVYLEGAVEIRSASTPWTRATQGMSLVEGDSLEVFGEGKAIITIDDGSAIRLNADARITLTSLDPNHIVITNEQGEVYARVATSERLFEVASKNVVYESLGTAYLTINNEGKNGVQVYHNKVKVKQEADTEKIIDEGQMYFVTNASSTESEKRVATIPNTEYETNSFVVWNAMKDADAYSEDLGTLSKAITSVDSIALTYLSGGKVSWNVEGQASHGFKLLWSKTSEPTYPLREGDSYEYYSDPNTRTGAMKASSGDGTYYIRVCEYLGGKCGKYSNQVQATFDNEPDEEPLKQEVTKKESPEPIQKEQPVNDTVRLTLKVSGSQSVAWSVDGYSKNGFKVVWSKSGSPTYPTRDSDQYIYLSSPEAHSATLEAFDGSGTYYVRVCEYLGGKCGAYSNQVTISLGESTEKEEKANLSVQSISLKGNGSNVSWSVDGYSKNGFKVVWSKSGSPTYPTRDSDQYIYLSSPEARSATLEAFDGTGTYYVRVCEYLGGKCGAYSNQVTTQL